MNVYRGRVRNGRLLVDQATDLPEGSTVDLVLPDSWDDLDVASRERLHAALEKSKKEARAGLITPAARVLRTLNRR